MPPQNADLLREFEDLAKVLLGLDGDNLSVTLPAHVYRVGVTNAADRGLDMWSNFGVAIQVKHLTLDEGVASTIVDQVESDRVVVVCRDADAAVLATVLKQIGYGRRVRGIVKEFDLVTWYERCLRGKFASQLGGQLLNLLADGFKAEFPHEATAAQFCEDRGYTALNPYCSLVYCNRFRIEA